MNNFEATLLFSPDLTAKKIESIENYLDSINVVTSTIAITDIVKQLPHIFEGFWNNDAARTCKSCSAYLEKS